MYRIGIHLGDVIFSGNDVMGNGVNIAARLQNIAAPGGICLSQTIHDVVKNQLSLSASYGGQRKLKGISEPVAVYQISGFRNLEENHHKVFISYRAQEPDKSLALQFYEALTKAGNAAFMAGESIRLGENWPTRIETELKQSDYLLLLLIVGRHPYLVRLTLYHIARGDIAINELLKTAATDSGIYGDHLRQHLWNLQQNPDLLAAAKKVVDSVDSVQLDSIQGFKLHSMGLVNLHGNYVIPRCDLYRMYFRDRLKK